MTLKQNKKCDLKKKKKDRIFLGNKESEKEDKAHTSSKSSISSGAEGDKSSLDESKLGLYLKKKNEKEYIDVVIFI